MNKLSIWHWIVLIAGVFVTALLVIGFTAAIYEKGIGSGEAASWLQAIGTMLAICVAIWVPFRQRQSEIKEASAEQTRRSDLAKASLLTVAEELTILLSKLADYAQQHPVELRFNRMAFEDMLIRLRALHFDEIGGDGMKLVHLIRILITDVCTTMERLEGKPVTSLEIFLQNDFAGWAGKAFSVQKEIGALRR